jgi:hypothetical protein
VEQKVAATCDGEPLNKNRPFASDATFNVYNLIPPGSSFYHYDGSLTTPPCSEVVWWEVADTPLSISPAQYERLVRMTTTYTDPNTCELHTAASPLDGSTNRPIAQDLNGRQVQRICPTGDIDQSTAPPEQFVVASADIGGASYAAPQPYVDYRPIASTEPGSQSLLPGYDDDDVYAGL